MLCVFVVPLNFSVRGFGRDWAALHLRSGICSGYISRQGIYSYKNEALQKSLPDALCLERNETRQGYRQCYEE